LIAFILVPLSDRHKNAFHITTFRQWRFLERREQEEIRRKMQASDDEGFDLESIKYVGGTDISFVKGSDEACACLAVLKYPSLEVVGTIMRKVRMMEPYIAGFLAFRESPPLRALLEEMRKEKKLPEPDVWLIDGNGMLHPRRCGLACQFGVEAGVRTVGVGKNFLHVDTMTKDGVAAAIDKYLPDPKASSPPPATSASADAESVPEGEPLPPSKGDIIGEALVLRSPVDSKPVGAAVLSGNGGSRKPIFVSVGHRVGLESAVKLVQSCCKYRLPEPVRAADLTSRDFLRQEEQREKAA